MVLQLGALRDALLEAGASTEKANKAAEEAAGYDHRLTRLEADVTVIKSDVVTIKADVAVLRIADVRTRGEQVLMRWMVGTVIAFQIAMTIRLFTH